MISKSSIFKALAIVRLQVTHRRSITAAEPTFGGKPVKLDTFSYSASAGWSVAPLPDLDSDDTLVVVFGAPELDEVQAPLGQLMAAYGRSHVIGSLSAQDESFAAVDSIARKLNGPSLRAVVLLSDGLNVNGSELVRVLNSVLP